MRVLLRLTVTRLCAYLSLHLTRSASQRTFLWPFLALPPLLAFPLTYSLPLHSVPLYAQLINPKKYIPGTKVRCNHMSLRGAWDALSHTNAFVQMVFAGLKKPEERADLIAYLKDATK